MARIVWSWDGGDDEAVDHTREQDGRNLRVWGANGRTKVSEMEISVCVSVHHVGKYSPVRAASLLEHALAPRGRLAVDIVCRVGTPPAR